MVPYFVTFGLSSLCCALGEYCSHRQNRRKAALFFTLAVIIVSVLAGVRDLEVGSDIWTYGEWAFNAAKNNSNIVSYISEQSDLEPLYNIFVWIIAQFATDSHWLYFFTGLVTYYFIMRGILNYEKQISVTLAWLVFLLLYYGDTLNAMRQFIAVAIAFWGLKLAFEGKYRKYLAVTIIAALFHYTAILSFLILAVILFLKKMDTFLRRIFVVLLVAVSTIMYSQLLEMFIGIGLVTEKYSRYYATNLDLSLNPILIRLPFLIVIAIFYRTYCNGERKYTRKFESTSEADIIIMLLIIDILVSAMRGTVSTLYRASFQFGIYRTIGYSRVCSTLRKNNRFVFILLLLIYLIILWIYQNVMQGNNDIYPYTSKILGIG